jgi:hypothetical protein
VAGAVTTGGWSSVTVIAVVAEPESAFEAVKATLYGVPRPSANVGVHRKVPDVCPAFVVNAALLPAGRAEKFAVKDVIACPSGSEAETVKVIAVPSAPLAVAGDATTGGRSSATVIVVVAEPESVFDAVKIT